MAKKKSVKKKAAAKKDEPSFEEALAELEGIVGELESGDLPLSDSIQKYELGVKLLKQCHVSLDQVQRRIELLKQVDKEGQAATVPFDGDGTPADGPARGKAETADNQAEDVDDSGRVF